MKTKLKNRRTQLKRVFCVWMLLLIAIIHTNTAFAQVKESEAEKQTEQETEQVQEKKEEKVLRFPNKLEAKEPPNNSQDSGNSSSNSNNMGIATQPSTAKAQLIENVNNANGDYPIHHGNVNGEIKDKYSADARQFITFKTKSGKTFHLIINHDEEGQNVMLLTEVSEDDLLNMVEKKEKPKEEIKKIEEPVPVEEIKKEEPKKEESKGGGSYIFLGIIVLAVVGAGYYFKIYKKRQEEQEEDEEYDEFEDEYEREDDAEDSEEKEQQNIDDMAIDSYDEDEE